MNPDTIQSLTEAFEGHAQQTENGVEYWLARDIQHLLGYSKWDNFLNVVSKGHLEKYKFSWEWLRDFSGFRLFRFAIWQLIEVPRRL